MKRISKDFKIDIMRQGDGTVLWRYSRSNKSAYEFIPNMVWAVFHHWHYEYVDFSIFGDEDDYYLMNDNILNKIIHIKTYNQLCDIISLIEKEAVEKKFSDLNDEINGEKEQADSI